MHQIDLFYLLNNAWEFDTQTALAARVRTRSKRNEPWLYGQPHSICAMKLAR